MSLKLFWQWLDRERQNPTFDISRHLYGRMDVEGTSELTGRNWCPTCLGQLVVELDAQIERRPRHKQVEVTIPGVGKVVLKQRFP